QSTTGVRCSLGLSISGTGSAPQSRSDALLRTMTADEKFLADLPVPRFHSALRSGTPRAVWPRRAIRRRQARRPSARRENVSPARARESALHLPRPGPAPAQPHAIGGAPPAGEKSGGGPAPAPPSRTARAWATAS